MSTYRFDAVHSRDDNGYYCEVIEQRTGRTVHTTKVFGAQKACDLAAKMWVMMQAVKERGVSK